MDKNKGLSEKREVEDGLCEDLKGEEKGSIEKGSIETEKETERDVSYNESTRYYWF